jgi:RND family efflux transporter MFP subunit
MINGPNSKRWRNVCPNSKGKSVTLPFPENRRNFLSGAKSLMSIPLFGGMLLLAACTDKPAKTEDIRPVRVLVVAPSGAKSQIELAGEVQPRYESRLGFRVGGKVIARKVDVGTVVKRGQLLMQLDASDFQLAQAQAKASVSAADSTLSLAQAELNRYRELRQKNFVSQAVLESKEAAYKAALANHEQATVGLKVQANQSSYTSLIADADGVVTGIEAEVGQVVSPGLPVVRIARTGEKEVRVSIPEDQVAKLKRVSDVTVRTWANPELALEGRLRELSPVADPATRTFTAKIALPKAGSEIQLGMTATVAFATEAAPGIRLPMTALFNHKEKTAVWVVEQGAVKLVMVDVAGAIGNEIVIASGLAPSQVVVTAGVNLLREGQKVTVLGDTAATPTQGQTR